MRSIELKIIFIFIFFTTIVLGIEHYQLSNHMIKQYTESKQSKNELLIDTISPIITLDLSLNLNSSYKEYLKQIIQKNSDLKAIHLSNDDVILFNYEKNDFNESLEKHQPFSFVERKLKDPITQENLATLELHFSTNDYDKLIDKNNSIGIQTALIILLLLIFFIFLVKKEFFALKLLRNLLLAYDPSQNNFPKKPSKLNNEIGLITNAIITMVNRIAMHTKQIETLNASLEEKVKQRTLELEKSNNNLKQLASTDPLTGLYNRRYFISALKPIVSLEKRKHKSLSLIMLDIDFFKKINDTYGHNIGDSVLISFSNLQKENTRESDIICRFGGEEFLILLPETNLDGALTIAKKIRKAAEKDEVEVLNVQDTNIYYSVSAGVIEVDLDKEYDIETSLKRVDDLLYKAKEKGRNRVES